MLHTLVFVIVSLWGLAPTISHPVRTTDDVGSLCAMADRVGDCACAISFLYGNLPAEETLIMLELWAAQSSHSRRPTARELAQWHGEAAIHASLAFDRKLTEFQQACPGNRLVLDDGDHEAADVLNVTHFSGLPKH